MAVFAPKPLLNSQPNPQPSRISEAFPGARSILSAIVFLLHRPQSTLTNALLKSRNIYTSTGTPGQPEPTRHPLLSRQFPTHSCYSDLEPLSIPGPWPGSIPSSGTAWASLFRDISRRLSLWKSHHDEPVAWFRKTEWENPWERLIASGQQDPRDHYSSAWHMVAMLENKDLLGCIVANNSSSKLADDVSFYNCELVCLLALLCRQLADDPENTCITPIVISFTSDSVRVLQAQFELPPNEHGRVHITKRFELPLADIIYDSGGGEGSKEEVYKRWVDVVSWLTFAPGSLRLRKPKGAPVDSGAQALDEVYSERLSSGEHKGRASNDDSASTSSLSEASWD